LSVFVLQNNEDGKMVGSLLVEAGQWQKANAIFLGEKGAI